MPPRPTLAAAALGVAMMLLVGPAAAQPQEDLSRLCGGRVGFSSARFIVAAPEFRRVEYTLVVGVRNTWTRPFTFTATIHNSQFRTTYHSPPIRLTPGSTAEATVGMAAPDPARDHRLREPRDYLRSVVVTCTLEPASGGR